MFRKITLLTALTTVLGVAACADRSKMVSVTYPDGHSKVLQMEAVTIKERETFDTGDVRDATADEATAFLKEYPTQEIKGKICNADTPDDYTLCAGMVIVENDANPT